MNCPGCGNPMQQKAHDFYTCEACGCHTRQLTIFAGATVLETNIDIEPMGAVRMTGRGKFVKPAAMRYLTYKQEIAWHLRQLYKQQPRQGHCRVTVVFKMPIPASYSKKKQAALPGKGHDKKPDIDNLIKGLFDAANGIVWADDNRVTEVTACKIYAEKPGILLEVQEIKQLERAGKP